MKPPATLADVAKLAGVSRATASLALNGQPGPSSETQLRVRQAAQELGYRPNTRARRLRGAKSHCVGLLTTAPEAVVGHDSNYSFQIAIAVPLSRILLAHGYSMLLIPPLKDISQLDDLDMDAAVIIEPREGEPIAAELQRRGISTVTVGEVPGLSVDAVVDRGYSGADVIFKHLKAQGAKNIVVLLGEQQNSVTMNVLDFLGCQLPESSTIGDAFLFDSMTIRIAMTDIDTGGSAARAVVADLLVEHPEVDAIYAPTDLMAIGALAGAADVGRIVPDNLLIATNYNGPRAQNAAPALTTLNLDMTAVAQKCTELIMECVEGKPSTKMLRRTIPEPGIIIRSSTEVGS